MKKNGIKILLIVLIIALLVPTVVVASACGPEDDFTAVGQVSGNGGEKEISDGGISVKRSSNTTKKFKVTVGSDGIFAVRYKITSGDSSKITVTTNVYDSAKTSYEIKPISTSGKYLYYRLDRNYMAATKNLYFVIKVKNAAKTDSAKVKYYMSYNLDSKAQDQLGKDTISVNGKGKYTYSYAKSYVWSVTERNHKEYKKGIGDVTTVDYKIYLNRIDTQILYGLLKKVTTERSTSNLAKKGFEAVKAVFNNSSNKNQKVQDFVSLIDSNKKYLLAEAFNIAVDKVGDILLGKVLKVPGVDDFVKEAVKEYAKKMAASKVASGFISGLLGKVADKAADGIIPSFKVNADSFDLAYDKICSLFKSDIKKIKNFDASATVTNKNAIPLVLFSAGICMANEQMYRNQYNFFLTRFNVTKWDDRVSSSLQITGHLGEKGKFTSLDSSGGVNSVYTMLGNRKHVTLE